MDVPQQVGPAALLGAVVVMVGGIEVADQHPGELLAQDLVHHLLVLHRRRKYRSVGVLKLQT